MTCILVIAAADASRRWEHELVRRLLAAGHDVHVRPILTADAKDSWLDRVLAVEARRFGASLLSNGPPLSSSGEAPFAAEIVIDLTGVAPAHDAPVLQVQFNGQFSLPRGIAAMLARNAQVELDIFHNGIVVGRARPMIGDRVWLSRFGDDLLAGAIALIEQTLARCTGGALPAPAEAGAGLSPQSTGFLRQYLPFLARGLAARLVHKIFRWRRPFYWQVGYRLIEGPGVAESGRLDGTAFTKLPDDGARFYADPFPFEHEGRRFLFVEEFPYATGKGVISVAELGADGAFARPRIVLEEPHHLSYPQVLQHDGEIYMLPESSAANELVLYRAAQFPDQWVRDTVLIAARNINDATLLRTGDRLWLFASERFDHGSASDKLVVYSAPDLRGPWVPHCLNPLTIDHSAARPGGQVIHQGGQVLLPVQNGSVSYGGGLGLMTIERLDADAVVFSRPRPIGPGAAWAGAGIHTLNRAGSLEVIDSAG